MMSQKKFPEKSSKIKESPETYLSLRVSRQLKVSRVYSLTQIPVNPLSRVFSETLLTVKSVDAAVL